MKTIHILLLASVMLIAGCSTSEPGSVELPNLSKKVFDALRIGDDSKFELLIPNKRAYNQYRVIVEKETGQTLVGLDTFKTGLFLQYDAFRSVLGDISEATHSNSTEEHVKSDAANRAVVTTKFSIGGELTKYQFDAIKLDNHWFCLGNFKLLQKAVAE